MLGRANCELLTPAIKECRLVSVCPPTARPPPITCTRQPRRRSQGSSRIAYARQIEIVMRPATFISILRESHLPFSKNDDNSNRPHTSLNEAHPDGVRKPPDEALTILELLSLHLGVDGLAKAIACDQPFQKTPSPKA